MQHLRDRTQLDRDLLDAIQHEVPLVARPWQALGERVGATEHEVLAAIGMLRRDGIIRQVGAIFDTRRLGYESSLVAARVDPAGIDVAAEIVSLHPGVSHNYEREHDYNLWFTIAVSPRSELGLEATVDRLRRQAGLDATRLLPALRVFRIGVNFDIRGGRAAGARRSEQAPPTRVVQHRAMPVHEDPRAIEAVLALQRDLPAVEEPFALLAAEHGFGADELLELGEQLRAERIMRRYAAVLHHRRAGFRANGMGVWIVPPEEVDDVGRMMASFEGVSHCYSRPTYDDWPYSLFTMTHGESREECEAVLAEIAAVTGQRDYDVLYSRREFKKVRVRYFTPEQHAWERLVTMGASA